MQLFRLQPIEFLLKPLDYERVAEVMRLWGELNYSAEKCLEIKTGKRLFRIPYDDILYLYSDNKTVNVVMEDREEHFYGKLKNLRDILPENFVTIHQSYIINVHYVEECCYEQVRMKNGALLNISQTYRKGVRKRNFD